MISEQADGWADSCLRGFWVQFSALFRAIRSSAFARKAQHFSDQMLCIVNIGKVEKTLWKSLGVLLRTMKNSESPCLEERCTNPRK